MTATEVTKPEQHRLEYRQAIARFATGVTIITTDTPDGYAGMTASAVSSLSLEPRLLLVCISNHLPTHRAIQVSRRFAVNVLGAGDAALARRFASPREDKFAGLELDCSEGVPLLRRAIAHFVCDVTERFPGGDHSIFIGGVRRCDHQPEARPLVFYASSFRDLRHEDDDAPDPWAWSAAVGL
jgi:flavin reductase (DIM6/NTAB) family NADH-FMN oxidoreductase RutF